MCDEDELLARLPTLVALHDSVELYWLPYTDRVWLRTSDRAAGPAGRLGFGFLSTNFFQMFAFIGVIGAMAPWLASPLLRVGSRFLVFQEQTAGVDPDGQFANPLTRRLGWSVQGPATSAGSLA